MCVARNAAVATQLQARPSRPNIVQPEGLHFERSQVRVPGDVWGGRRVPCTASICRWRGGGNPSAACTSNGNPQVHVWGRRVTRRAVC